MTCSLMKPRLIAVAPTVCNATAQAPRVFGMSLLSRSMTALSASAAGAAPVRHAEVAVMFEPSLQSAKPFMKRCTRRVNRSRSTPAAVKSTPFSTAVEVVVRADPLPRVPAPHAETLVEAATRTRPSAKRDADDDTSADRAICSRNGQGFVGLVRHDVDRPSPRNQLERKELRHLSQRDSSRQALRGHQREGGSTSRRGVGAQYPGRFAATPTDAGWPPGLPDAHACSTGPLSKRLFGSTEPIHESASGGVISSSRCCSSKREYASSASSRCERGGVAGRALGGPSSRQVVVWRESCGGSNSPGRIPSALTNSRNSLVIDDSRPGPRSDRSEVRVDQFVCELDGGG